MCLHGSLLLLNFSRMFQKKGAAQVTPLRHKIRVLYNKCSLGRSSLSLTSPHSISHNTTSILSENHHRHPIKHNSHQSRSNSQRKQTHKQQHLTMPTTFLTLPREIRDIIYELTLLHHEPICPWPGHRDSHLTSGLLRTNKNHFDFRGYWHGCGSPEDVASFLDSIGHANRECVQNIYVDFPEDFELEVSYAIPKWSPLRIIKTIQNRCDNVQTIRSLPWCHSRLVHQTEGQVDDDVTAALTRLDAMYRGSPFLRKIEVEISGGSLPTELLKRLGWTIGFVDDTYQCNEEGYWRRCANCENVTNDSSEDDDQNDSGTNLDSISEDTNGGD